MLKIFRRYLLLFLVGCLASGAIAACSGLTAGTRPVEVTLVSFAVTKAAYQQILPKFEEKWRREHNQTVVFNQSYGGSGSQTRAVVDGLEADVVHLALGLDTQKIQKAGLINQGWEKELPHQAIVTKSVSAIVIREGNPKNIQSWADLAKPGVSVITADPRTSGVARWTFLSLWNAAKATGDAAKATEFVTQVYRNVPILTRDAREASDAFFRQHEGDALINYENEVLLAAEKGEKLPYEVPSVNISIDNTIALVDQNVDKHGNRAVAEAFVQYLFTPEAQQEFARVGFRPVNETVQQAVKGKFPAIPKLSTVKNFGGWSEIQKQFFADGALFDQIQNKKSS
jgi:sulfate/thiosulfate transport system substrate-binding protein